MSTCGTGLSGVRVGGMARVRYRVLLVKLFDPPGDLVKDGEQNVEVMCRLESRGVDS